MPKKVSPQFAHVFRSENTTAAAIASVRTIASGTAHRAADGFFFERGELDAPALHACLRAELGRHLTPPPDAVVLGCTHSPFLRAAIARTVGASCELLDGADGTARETQRRLKEAGLLRTAGTGAVDLTDSDPSVLPLAERLLNAE